ncbi:uncharacterized protein PV09_09307 [Verruconis gallopava]|uniref:Uncharacterized protein n=1 Tax=Verruconis gallopava TaxID=253628 RepID=A0A0D1YE57_9PEZI|nr:uncharacterized protein PV09_09307 [Verruconis gallopava]KIV98981.1 hypothetical protein PV09_09307 [Verruconis gallopava]
MPVDYDSFYRYCADKVTDLSGKSPKFEPSSRAAFEAAAGNFDIVALKLRLDLKGPNLAEPDGLLFNLTVKPLALELSDRFRTGFEWDRVAYLDVSTFKNAPAHIKSQNTEFLDAFNDWLDPDKPKRFLGRTIQVRLDKNIMSYGVMKRTEFNDPNPRFTSEVRPRKARFNGAKGVWHQSCSHDPATDDDWGIWIEIPPSQWKFPMHDGDTDQSFDPVRLTFEVIK